MRSFSKKLAFVLAAAMVVTSFAPAAKAEAAKEMAINKSSQILYVNEGINHKGADGVAAGKGNVSVYDFSVKNKPADWKDTLSFKWTTSDDEVVAVKAGGVATAVGVGKATITCKVTDKATKETVATLKTKVTVKANAADVEITNADDADGLAFAVDSTIDLNRAMYDEDGNKTTKRGKLVTDYTRWVAVPDTGVTIDNATGKFTFAEPGEYELYCETYQSKKYDKTTAKSDSVFVTITKDLEFKQTSLKKFDILLGTATDITAADVKVEEVVVGTTGDEYRVAALVKGVTMSDDKKTATVETYYDFKDGVTYEVTVKGYDKAAFVASAGEPVAMYVWAMDSYYKPIVAGQVTIGKSTELKYTLVDANGVDVTTENDNEKNKVRFNMKYISKAGASYDTTYYAGYSKFKFIEAGDSAVVTAVYSVIKDGKEVKVEAPAVNFYGVERQLVVVKSVVDFSTNGDYYSATKDMIKLTKTSDLKVKLELIDGEKIDVTTQNQYIKDAERIDNSCWITVETAKSSKDLIDIYATANQALTLHPRKAGLAQLMVYYNVRLSDGTVMKTAIAPLNVKVADAPILGAVNLNWSGAPKTVVKSIRPDSATLNEEIVYVQIKDQYGDDYYNIAQKVIEGNDLEAAKLVGAGKGIDWDGNNIKVDASKFKARIEAMNADYNPKDELFGIFTFTVKVQDKANWQWKTNEIIVDVRGRNTDGVAVVGTDHDRDSSLSGNIARLNAWDPWNARNQKYVQFQVFDKMNGANINYRNVEPWTKDIDITTATTGYYFKLFKDGVDVTTERLKDKSLVNLYDGKSMWQLNYSMYKTENGHQIVSYDNLGAGTYRFEVYNVQKSEYPGVTDNVVYLEGNAVRTTTVTCDAGQYKLTARNDVVIKNGTGKVPGTVNAAGELVLNAGEKVKILKCFNFENKNGTGFNKYATDNNGVSLNTDTVAAFYDGTVDYHIEINEELSQPNSVYVDYITFYEKLTDGTNVQMNDNKPVYAAYKVEIDCFVEYQKQQ